MNSIIESFAPTAATLGGGFFVGILVGYALKKVIKLRLGHNSRFIFLAMYIDELG